MPLSITSPHNPRVREAIKLRERKGRQRQHRIIIDGAREIAAAIRGGVVLDELFLRDNHRDQHEQLRRAAEQLGAQILSVDASVFAKLEFGQRGEGVVATAPLPAASLESLSLPPQPLVAVLEGVEKPGNIGAVLRTADAAGASALILADPVSDLYNPNAIRASLGAVFLRPVASAASQEVLAWLQARDFSILAARIDGPTSYSQVDMRPATALVLGSESGGLSDAWRDPSVREISLPMRGAVDSLNVSTTAAVLLYEALRQRMIGVGKPG